ncbi:MAG: bifunctional DNA primase/polymerase [Planctomycetales bacterium]|nr:bifunctional DNA primase/polymerase [Planctomycetales bacterium]
MSHHPAKYETRLQVGPDVLAEALRLHSLGLSVIPIGTEKRPAVRWKPFQREAADERQLWDWWYGRDDLGIGIVLGTVSQDVCGRDFDSPESFGGWITRNRTLANELPITRARRGGHVYYRDAASRTTTLTDGEIRASGGYLIVPPSLHPSGVRYEWLRPFHRLPPFVDPVEAGLRPKAAAEESSQDRSITALGNTIGASLETAVANAIRATLPRHFGERNDLIFQFARRLKALPDLRGLAGRDVLAHAEEWFRSALPSISTKEWQVTRSAFLSAWPRITHPFTDGTLTACLADVDASLPSPIALRYLNDPVTVRLIGLCERLQRIAGSEPFFLSTEACHLFGLNHKMQLSRRLERLRDDGVLVRLTIGNSIQRRASEYRFLPAKEADVNSIG